MTIIDTFDTVTSAVYVFKAFMVCTNNTIFCYLNLILKSYCVLIRMNMVTKCPYVMCFDGGLYHSSQYILHDTMDVLVVINLK